MRKRGLIALGWGWTDDLRKLRPTAPRIISEHITGLGKSGGPTAGRCLWRLYGADPVGSLQIHDLVILGHGATREWGRALLVVEVTGPYDYSTDGALDDYFHIRPARPTTIQADWLWRQMTEGYPGGGRRALEGGAPPALARFARPFLRGDR